MDGCSLRTAVHCALIKCAVACCSVCTENSSGDLWRNERKNTASEPIFAKLKIFHVSVV